MADQDVRDRLPVGSGELEPDAMPPLLVVSAKWFTLIADRIGRPLDGATVLTYQHAFERAHLTPRGLDAALGQLFETVQFWNEIIPMRVIDLARDWEVSLRLAERPLLPVRDRAREAGLQDEIWLDVRERKARDWAAKHPDEAKAIRRAIQREYCLAYRVSGTRSLSPLKQIQCKWAVIMALLSARARGHRPSPPSTRQASAGDMRTAPAPIAKVVQQVSGQLFDPHDDGSAE